MMWATAMLSPFKKRISLTSFEFGTNMAAVPLSSNSQGIDCKSRILINLHHLNINAIQIIKNLHSMLWLALPQSIIIAAAASEPEASEQGSRS